MWGSKPIQNLLITTLSFSHLEQNGFTISKLYLSTVGWKLNVTRRLNDKMDYGFKKMNKMDYGFKKMNDTMTKAEVMGGWVMMSWWNLSVMKSMTKQRDDQNPNLQSIFSLGYQWYWSSQAICLAFTPTLNGNSDYRYGSESVSASP